MSVKFTSCNLFQSQIIWGGNSTVWDRQMGPQSASNRVNLFLFYIHEPLGVNPLLSFHSILHQNCLQRNLSKPNILKSSKRERDELTLNGRLWTKSFLITAADHHYTCKEKHPDGSIFTLVTITTKVSITVPDKLSICVHVSLEESYYEITSSR